MESFKRGSFFFLFVVVVVSFFFLSHGFLTALLCSFNRIMTIPYGPNQDAFFTFSAFLVLNNRIVVVFVALGLLSHFSSFVWLLSFIDYFFFFFFSALLIIQGESIQNVAPLHKYFYISFSNTIASFCQYESLRYISFPTQTLGKCGKMIPVMIIRFFLFFFFFFLFTFLSSSFSLFLPHFLL